MHRNRARLLLVLCGLVSGNACFAQSEPLIPFAKGDTWTYRQTVALPGQDEQTYNPRFGILFANKDGRLVYGRSASTPGATWTPAGAIPGNSCIRDFAEDDALGLTDSCGAQLEPGKTWESNQSDSLAEVKTGFKVVGIEDVVVPAGSYKAIRIESKKVITTVAYAGVAAPRGGYVKHISTTYWFSPQAKGFVKTVMESRLPDGSLFLKLTNELIPTKVESQRAK
ncbi:MULTISPECIES: hypothetical protein [unclassified Duganella]|uniref:hypothetical protein n=1 Tax=unclassified Duganella TaxID=2636909 RepID=UPI000E345FCE|nr:MULTISPECIES: hypothetical protein [unclassified Duganella]RFP18895.1 hypothetical protein D0T23_03670 [Duganella sp. BJB475]RFP35558.1 hypothetical protein D0T21_03670 [Duganella sp. BJB476]